MVVISGFMFTTDVKRPSYATPVRPDSPNLVGFLALSVYRRIMIENTRSQELKGDKHAQEV